MSISKVLCIAMLGSILFASAAIAQPERAGQPPAKAVQKSHHRHQVAKQRKHHLKRLLRHYHRHAHRHTQLQRHAAPRATPR